LRTKCTRVLSVKHAANCRIRLSLAVSLLSRNIDWQFRGLSHGIYYNLTRRKYGAVQTPATFRAAISLIGRKSSDELPDGEGGGRLSKSFSSRSSLTPEQPVMKRNAPIMRPRRNGQSQSSSICPLIQLCKSSLSLACTITTHIHSVHRHAFAEKGSRRTHTRVACTCVRVRHGGISRRSMKNYFRYF